MSDTTQLLYLTLGTNAPDDAVDDVVVTNGTSASSTSYDHVSSIAPGVLRSITMAPQDGVYFISADNGDIYEEHAGQSPSFSSAVVNNPAGGSASILSTSVDTSDNTLYFIDGSSLYAEQFTAGFASPTGLTNLGNVDDIGGTSEAASGAMVYDQADHTAYYAGGSGSVSIGFSGTTGSITGNYIYKVSGLTSGASHGTITNALGGTHQVPLVDGVVEGMAIDTATDTLYFTTKPTPDLGSTPHAGIYDVALSGPNAGVIETLYSQAITDYSSPFAQMGTIAIDSQTGEYYIATESGTSGTAGEIYTGNVNNTGTAPVLLTSTDTTSGGEDGQAVPLALAVDGGPTVSGISVAGIDGNGGHITGVITTADTVTLALTMSGAVTVSGTPALTLNDGATAHYVSGTGTDILLFTYTPGGGQDTATLGATGLTGTVTDAFGAGFDGSLTASFAGLGVDTTPPGLTISGTSSDALQGGGSISALTGAPTISDSFGTGTLTSATIAIANAQSGDVLGINGTTSGALDGISYNFSGSALTLSGSASIGNYETVLGDVTYSDGGTDGATSGHPVRTLNWNVAEGALVSATQTSSITIERALTLSAGGTVTLTSGGSVAVDSGIAITDLDNDPVTSAVVAIVSGFELGDELNFTNQNGITGSYDAATGTLSLSGSASAADYQAALASVSISSLNADPSDGGADATRAIGYEVADATGVGNFGFSTVVAVCYLRGTSILTAAGEQPVEALAIGDTVATRSGGLRRIKWIGRQGFDARFVRNNREKSPVCIKAGALGGGLPLRDLFVSPGHSMLLGEILVLARNLVNGVTITQNETAEDVHYYNIELEAHDCVLAEGSWSESYADGPGLRAQFHNAAEFRALYPDYVEPQVVTTCLPRPEHGPALAAALAPVVARAAHGLEAGTLLGWVDRIEDGRVEGWAVDLAQPELPVLLEVLCGAEVLGTVLACDPREDLRAAGYGRGHCSFSFACPQGLTPVHITVRRAADGWVLPFAHALQEASKAA